MIQPAHNPRHLLSPRS